MNGILEIIQLGGGLAGYVSIFYLLLRKLRKKIRIYGVSGTYEVEETETKGFYNIKATVEVNFLNGSDETIAVTDVVGFLRYNKKLYEKYLSSLVNVPLIPEVYYQRPRNFREAANFNVAPGEVVRKSFEIVFPNMLLDLVDRMGIAHFSGFLNGKIPIFNVYEKELKEKWSDCPLHMLLSIHINGEKMRHIHVPLIKSERESLGTLSIIDVEKIKMAFQNNRL